MFRFLQSLRTPPGSSAASEHVEAPVSTSSVSTSAKWDIPPSRGEDEAKYASLELDRSPISRKNLLQKMRDEADQHMRAAADSVEKDYKNRLVDDPRLLALHAYILSPLRIVLSDAHWQELKRLPDATNDLEWELVQRLDEGRYTVSYTLMWLQTTCHPSYSLQAVLASPERCAIFVELAHALNTKHSNYRTRSEQRVQLIDTLAKRVHVLFSRAPTPFSSLRPFLLGSYAGTPTPRSFMERLLAMVREASHNKEASLPAMQAHLFAHFTDSDVNRLTQTLHSTAKLARYLSTFFIFPSTVAGLQYNQQTEQETLNWLKQYIHTGCKCDR